ncbi:beta strand repeat-containing protein [Pararhizobium antarcticum]|nr:calcium-binding protein [Pararhizobium antarcticum]
MKNAETIETQNADWRHTNETGPGYWAATSIEREALMSANITTKQTTTLNVNQSNDNWVVNIGGSIVVADGHGITNSGPFHDSVIGISGAVVANAKYKAGIFSNGVDAILQVDTMGSIHGYNGIVSYGENTNIKNFGQITAANIGIYSNAVESDIQNGGTITAKTGIYVETASSPLTSVYNTGTIKADIGILGAAGSVNIANGFTGFIEAQTVAIKFSENPQNQNFLSNYGSIESQDVAIQGSAGMDYVSNYHSIKGGIFLGAGDDVFINDGGTVDHAVDGGLGNDLYGFFNGKFDIIDAGGIDTITSDSTLSLNSYSTIENLTLAGVANINGTGNALANIITGNSGNNILDGGQDNVIDTLTGGNGNDTYVLGAGSDIVSDSGGIDRITSSISRSLANYSTIENLTLTGSGNINATGNGLNNVLTGNSGVNTLDGGSGNDTYVLGSGFDKVIDSSGIDTITSSISRSLMSYATIENLTLTGTGNINATGNALNNVLTGNSGMNTLNGGAGNDTYVLGSGFDKVIDSSGTDTITSLISRNLATFSTIENLKLLGAADINGTGNALANTLTGNSGINTLSGETGNDVLIGGAGADKLYGGAGTDTASYAGAKFGVVANLANASVNTGDAKGDTYYSIENLTGSNHSDTLTGNSGANVLTGGTGGDLMTGGAGADTFLFRSVGDSWLAPVGRDTILDFSQSQGDKISLVEIDADQWTSGNQAFVFIGNAAFSGGMGELRFESAATGTYVYADVNGDKVVDFELYFDDAINFQASDFFL